MAATATAADGLDGQLIGFALPSIIQEWGITHSAFAPAVATDLLGRAIGSAGAGLFADRFGCRMATIGSVFLFGIATCAIGFAPDQVQCHGCALHRTLQPDGPPEEIKESATMLSLHTYFRSSASYRVRIALELKALPYSSLPVHLVRGGGEQHAAAFAALNPAELVPVLRDGGVTLTQSMAIIEYLDEVHPAPPLLPGSAAERARIRALSQAIACEIHPLNNLRVLKWLQLCAGMDQQARSVWYAHWVNEGFRALESMLATSDSTGRFCHGDAPTLADCCLVPQIYNAERFAVSMEPYPTLSRIHGACLELPAFQRAAPETQADAA